MNKNNNLERFKKLESKLLQGIDKIEKSTCVRLQFEELNINTDHWKHDFDAPGDIYKTFERIKQAVLNEYKLDLEDLRSQMKKIEQENND
jgi:hypothetical protein